MAKGAWEKGYSEAQARYMEELRKERQASGKGGAAKQPKSGKPAKAAGRK